MPHRLLRDVILALAAKLLALTAIYLLFFFDGAHQPLLTPSTVASQILGDTTHADPR